MRSAKRIVYKYMMVRCGLIKLIRVRRSIERGSEAFNHLIENRKADWLNFKARTSETAQAHVKTEIGSCEFPTKSE
jgi:hypothetical protein